MGDAATGDADATDADNDTLTYSATGLPDGHKHRPVDGRHQRHHRRQRRRRQRHAHVSDGSLTATDTFTWTVAAANAAPVVDSAAIAPAAPRSDQVVTAQVTSHDAESDPLTTTYQWIRNGTDIAGATNATLDLALAGNGDKGDPSPCASPSTTATARALR